MKLSARAMVVLFVCLAAGASMMAVVRKRRPVRTVPLAGTTSTPTGLPRAVAMATPVAPRMDLPQIARDANRWLVATGPDPFAGALGITTNAPPSTVVTTNLLLSAIWCQPGHRMVVVNGQILHEGSILSPFLVQRIEPDAVVFSGPHGIVVLPIISSSRRGEAAKPVPPPRRAAESSRVARSSGG